MGTYRIAPQVVVRSASLPAAAIEGLRCDAAAKLVDVVIARERWCDTEGKALAALLYHVIGELPESTYRPSLVALRRALHTGRIPGSREWNPQIADVLDPALAERIARWLTHRNERSARRDELAGVLSAEMERGRRRMREVLADPAYQHALRHASPVLAGELAKWLAEPARIPRRRTLIGLAKYLSRATTKTSPFSTFTRISIGHWCEDGPAVQFLPTGEPRIALELDVQLVRQLIDAVIGRSALLRVNPSCQISADAVSFLGPGLAEPLVEITLVPAVREVLRIVERTEPKPRDAVCAELAHSASVTLERAAGFVARLEQAGLLETVAPLPDQIEHPIGALATSAEATGELLTTLQEQLSTPASAADDQCARVARTVVGVLDRLEEPAVDMHQMRQRGIHETYLRPGISVRCARPRWQQALDDLDSVRRLLGVYDPTLPFRLALGAYSRLRFGAGSAVPLLTLHRAMQQDLQDPDDSDLLAPFRPGFLAEPDPLVGNSVDRLRRLLELRIEATEMLTAGEESGWDEDRWSVRTEPATVAQLMASWPEWVNPPTSMACYVQPVPGDGPVRLVLNAAHSGHGRGRSRWHRLARQVGAIDPMDEPGGVTTAELGGSFGTNLNLRVATAPYEIGYPRAVSARPPDERIGLGSLTVRHDTLTDLVSLWSQGLQVIPMHGGMMSDALLPPAAQLLIYGFGVTYLTHPTLPALDLRPKDLNVLSKWPRIDVGRVTLVRARWTMPAEAVPLREPAESDVEYFVRLHSWLRENDIPQACFVRCWNPRMAREKLAFEKTHKPLYVDFNNWLLVQVFEHLIISRTGLVELWEALPRPGSYQPGTEYGTNMHEFLIEISGD